MKDFYADSTKDVAALIAGGWLHVAIQTGTLKVLSRHRSFALALRSISGRRETYILGLENHLEYLETEENK